MTSDVKWDMVRKVWNGLSVIHIGSSFTFHLFTGGGGGVQVGRVQICK